MLMSIIILWNPRLDHTIITRAFSNAAESVQM